MPKKFTVICPDCKTPLKGKNTIRVCKVGDSLIRNYCEDCGIGHLEILEEIRINSYEDPEQQDLVFNSETGEYEFP